MDDRLQRWKAHCASSEANRQQSYGAQWIPARLAITLWLHGTIARSSSATDRKRNSGFIELLATFHDEFTECKLLERKINGICITVHCRLEDNAIENGILNMRLKRLRRPLNALNRLQASNWVINVNRFTSRSSQLDEPSRVWLRRVKHNWRWCKNEAIKSIKITKLWCKFANFCFAFIALIPKPNEVTQYHIIEKWNWSKVKQ